MNENTYTDIERVKAREPLPDRVYNVLKKCILECKFPPGELLPEEKLTQATGASRTPVRAALLRLQAEGLVHIEPRKCARVFDLNKNDVIDLCNARVVFETAFFDHAVKNIPRNVFKKYRQRFLESNEQIVSMIDDPDKWQDKIKDYRGIDFEFHIALVAASNNKLWLELYRSILDRSKIYALLTLKRFPLLYHEPEHGNQAIQDQHHTIIDAILGEDLSEAKWLLRKHLEHFRDRTLKLFIVK